jgi:hypothetical protein
MKWKDRSFSISGNNLLTQRTNARWFQLFRYQDAHIINERGKAVDVSGGLDDENRNIIMWNKHNGLNQQWDIWYVDEMPPEPKKGELNERFNLYVERPFHIVTQMKSGRYLDVVGSDIVIKTPNGFKTQVWWFDQKSKTIKSESNHSKSFDIANAGRSNNLQLWATNSRWFQVFLYKNEHFVNVRGKKSLDVKGGQDREGQTVWVWKTHNGANQKWQVLYLDKKAKRDDKAISASWGFKIDKPFFMVSRMPMQRCAEAVGGSNLVLKRLIRTTKAQQFIFDASSKTVKSVQWKDRSL